MACKTKSGNKAFWQWHGTEEHFSAWLQTTKVDKNCRRDLSSERKTVKSLEINTKQQPYARFHKQAVMLNKFASSDHKLTKMNSTDYKESEREPRFSIESCKPPLVFSVGSGQSYADMVKQGCDEFFFSDKSLSKVGRYSPCKDEESYYYYEGSASKHVTDIDVSPQDDTTEPTTKSVVYPKQEKYNMEGRPEFEHHIYSEVVKGVSDRLRKRANKEGQEDKNYKYVSMEANGPTDCSQDTSCNNQSKYNQTGPSMKNVTTQTESDFFYGNQPLNSGEKQLPPPVKLSQIIGAALRRKSDVQYLKRPRMNTGKVTRRLDKTSWVYPTKIKLLTSDVEPRLATKETQTVWTFSQTTECNENVQQKSSTSEDRLMKIFGLR